MSLEIKSPGVKILLADDIPTNIDVLLNALESEDRVFAVANSGEAVLDIAPKFLPDIILLDVMMGGITGFETCKRLKAMNEFIDVPILFITARGEKSDIVEGFKYGGTDYITKPFQFEEVIARVKVHCENRRLLKEKSKLAESLLKTNAELTELNETIKNMQVQLIQSEKLAALGTTLAGIGHEVNNPCNSIINNVVSLKKCVEKVNSMITDIFSADSDGQRASDIFNPYFNKSKEIINHVDMSAKRIADIVLSMRSFARIDDFLRDVNVNEVAQISLRFMAHILENVEHSLEFNATNTVSGSPVRIGQVVTNLLSNALYAAQQSKHKPYIQLKTRDCKDGVIIEVSDNGTGIPQAIQSKIFDPFYTTKPVGSGTGLGLSLSRNIVLEHQGRLNFETTPNGTKFIIELPTSQFKNLKGA